MQTVDLVFEQTYKVYDLVTDTWNGGYKYLGYDIATRRFFFRTSNPYYSEYGQTYMFISLDPEDIKHRVQL